MFYLFCTVAPLRNADKYPRDGKCYIAVLGVNGCASVDTMASDYDSNEPFHCKSS